MVAGSASWASTSGWEHLPPHVAMALEQGWRDRLSQSNNFSFPLTARPDPTDARDVPYVPSQLSHKPSVLPDFLPSLDLSKVAPPVRAQGMEPTCAAQALATAIDCENLRRFSDEPKSFKPVSARYLFEASKVYDENSDDGLPGATLRGVLKGFWHRGACVQELMPYRAGYRNGNMTVAAARNAKSVSLGQYANVARQLLHFHSVLSERGPLIVSAMIHEGWMPHNVRKNDGEIKFGNSSKFARELYGAHAFSVVGYNKQGFIIVNNWGPEWGGFNATGQEVAKKNRSALDFPAVGLWSYEDWERNLLNAWTFRLAAPTGMPSGKSAGFVPYLPISRQSHREPPSVRELDVMGHIIHVRDRKLPESGLYASSLASLKATNLQILNSDRKYKHLAFLFFDVTESQDDQLRRAQLLVPRFKKLKIYPVFVLWQSPLSETFPLLMKYFGDAMIDRVGAATDLETQKRVLAKIANPVMERLWHDLLGELNDFGALQKAIDAVRQDLKAKGIAIHYASFGAGLLPLAKVMENAQADTISLVEPCCTPKFFMECFVAQSANLKRISIFEPGLGFTSSLKSEGAPKISVNQILPSIMRLPEDSMLPHPNACAAPEIRKFVRKITPLVPGSISTLDVLNMLVNNIRGKRGVESYSPFNGGFSQQDLEFR